MVSSFLSPLVFREDTSLEDLVLKVRAKTRIEEKSPSTPFPHVV
jgi:hypothetical protein